MVDCEAGTGGRVARLGTARDRRGGDGEGLSAAGDRLQVDVQLEGLARGDLQAHAVDDVAAVAAETRELAELACRRIKVDYEPLEAILSYDQALERTDVLVVADALAAAVVALLENPALSRKLAERARETATESFSQEAMVKRYERLYREVLRSGMRTR